MTGGSFWYCLKAFGHHLMSQGALCWLLWVFFICLCILLLLLFNIIFIVNIIFISSINIRIFIKSSLLVLWDNLTVWFCSFYFFIYLNLIHATTIGVDALSQYYHLASFNYGDMKATDIGQIDIIWAILCLVLSAVIIERWREI